MKVRLTWCWLPNGQLHRQLLGRADRNRYLDRLASFSRVIIFDKRGTGVSDPVPLDNMPPMELWMEDILTVMDAAESERAVVVGDTEGGAMAILFAATYPERTRSLVLINAIARLSVVRSIRSECPNTCRKLRRISSLLSMGRRGQ